MLTFQNNLTLNILPFLCGTIAGRWLTTIGHCCIIGRVSDQDFTKKLKINIKLIFEIIYKFNLVNMLYLFFTYFFHL